MGWIGVGLIGLPVLVPVALLVRAAVTGNVLPLVIYLGMLSVVGLFVWRARVLYG